MKITHLSAAAFYRPTSFLNHGEFATTEVKAIRLAVDRQTVIKHFHSRHLSHPYAERIRSLADGRTGVASIMEKMREFKKAHHEWECAGIVQAIGAMQAVESCLIKIDRRKRHAVV